VDGILKSILKLFIFNPVVRHLWKPNMAIFINHELDNNLHCSIVFMLFQRLGRASPHQKYFRCFETLSDLNIFNNVTHSLIRSRGVGRVT